MVKKERSNFSKFEENKLSSSEQWTVNGGKTAEPATANPEGNGTPITRTGTKPANAPLSTQNNGDPKPPGQDLGLFLNPFQPQP